MGTALTLICFLVAKKKSAIDELSKIEKKFKLFREK